MDDSECVGVMQGYMGLIGRMDLVSLNEWANPGGCMCYMGVWIKESGDLNGCMRCMNEFEGVSEFG